MPAEPAENPPSQAIAPRWLSRLVHWQDEAFRIPGTQQRVGLDAILGFLLPGVGDFASAAASMAVVLSAVRQGVPVGVLLVMMFNILFDTLVGAVPVLGDLFDVTFKASSKNLVLLERHGQREVVSGGARRFFRLLLMMMVIAVALCFVSAMIVVLMGFAWTTGILG